MQIFHEFYEGQLKQQICYSFILLILIYLKWRSCIIFFPNFDGPNAFSQLQQAKMSTIAVILTCISMINFIINGVEHGKNVITSGPGHPPSPIRMFAGCTKNALGISFSLSTAQTLFLFVCLI